MGVMRHLQRNGISIPHDIALTGCDNTFLRRI
ncbi:MAG: hypothetical protein IJQ33_04575 [Clostridia bacterium]|nr:hypothetical protein [Clostridia bacterium]